MATAVAFDVVFLHTRRHQPVELFVPPVFDRDYRLEAAKACAWFCGQFEARPQDGTIRLTRPDAAGQLRVTEVRLNDRGMFALLVRKRPHIFARKFLARFEMKPKTFAMSLV